MDNKHFIWISPLLLVIGFIVGWISGISLPEHIVFEIDKDSREWLADYTNQTYSGNYYVTERMCYNSIMSESNSIKYCIHNFLNGRTLNINGTQYVEWDLIASCEETVDMTWYGVDAVMYNE